MVVRHAPGTGPGRKGKGVVILHDSGVRIGEVLKVRKTFEDFAAPVVDDHEA